MAAINDVYFKDISNNNAQLLRTKAFVPLNKAKVTQTHDRNVRKMRRE